VSTSSIILKKISEAEQQCENYILEQAAGIVFRGIGVLPRTAGFYTSTNSRNGRWITV
jgi:hypothetical protein